MTQLDKYFSEKLAKLESDNLLRTIRSYGSNLVDFSSNDYLGLKNNEDIKTAAIEATKKYGTGAGSSRLVSGNSKLYDELEDSISDYYSKTSACVFSSGYSANQSSIPALVGKGDLIIADKLSHSCIIEGAQLSNAKFLRFKHNDYSNLKKILTEERWKYRSCIIISEAVFSMDGDKADISKITKLSKEYRAWSYIDYAHEILPHEIYADIVMGTFSKAFASLGGYVCASDEVIKYIKTSAKGLIYSTALPPSILSASNKAVLYSQKHPELANEAIKNAEYFCDILELPSPASQIVPVILGEEKRTLEAQQNLLKQGFLVSAIRPPTVPKNTSRLRFSFSASHSKEQIAKLTESVKNL